MPRRPRSHVLESESRMAAQRVFQHAGWVTRDLEPDYGLDQHVEVFDQGVATGLFFFTQVKATDEPDLHRALAVSFTASNLDYFEAVDDPVLLLRFHAPTQTFFGRWFHRLDDRSSEAATSTVRFSPNGVVDEESLAALRNEVVLFRTLRDAIVRWPLVVRVSSTNPPVLADDVAVACTAAAGRQRYVKYVTAGPSDEVAEAAVIIADDHVVVHLGVASVTLHDAPEQREFGELVADLVFSTGLCLLVAGHYGPGARLLRQTVARAAAVREPEILMRTAASLAQGGRIDDAIAIARTLIAAGRTSEAKIIVTFSAMPIADELTQEEAVEVGNLLDELAAALASEDRMAGASAYYSSANWHFNARNYEQATAAYEKAAELDASYVERPYYQREVAGALFEVGDYERAAAWYERALRTSADQAVKARLGDCLLRAGRYRHALEVLEQYAAAPLVDEPIWLLKTQAAAHIVAWHGDQQEREPEQAEALAQEALSLGDDPRALQLAEQALALDALSGSAWWAVGRWHVNAGAGVEEGLPALVTAITEGGDTSAWVDLILVAIHGSDENLVSLIVRASCWDDAPALLDGLREKLMTAPPELRTMVLELAREEAAKLPSREGFTVRFAYGPG